MHTCVIASIATPFVILLSIFVFGGTCTLITAFLAALGSGDSTQQITEVELLDRDLRFKEMVLEGFYSHTPDSGVSITSIEFTKVESEVRGNIKWAYSVTLESTNPDLKLMSLSLKPYDDQGGLLHTYNLFTWEGVDAAGIKTIKKDKIINIEHMEKAARVELYLY